MYAHEKYRGKDFTVFFLLWSLKFFPGDEKVGITSCSLKNSSNYKMLSIIYSAARRFCSDKKIYFFNLE